MLETSRWFEEHLKKFKVIGLDSARLDIWTNSYTELVSGAFIFVLKMERHTINVVFISPRDFREKINC